MSLIFLDEVVSDRASRMKQNNSVLLIPNDPVTDYFQCFLSFVAAASLDHKTTLLLRPLDMIIFDFGILTFCPTEGDVGP